MTRATLESPFHGHVLAVPYDDRAVFEKEAKSMGYRGQKDWVYTWPAQKAKPLDPTERKWLGRSVVFPTNDSIRVTRVCGATGVAESYGVPHDPTNPGHVVAVAGKQREHVLLWVHVPAEKQWYKVRDSVLKPAPSANN